MAKFSIFNFQFLKFSIKLISLFLLQVLLVPSSSYLLSKPVRAQDFSFSLYPPLLELMIMPGKSYVQPFTLTNTGAGTTLTPSLVAFTPKDELGHILLNQPSTINHLPLIIQFDSLNLKLNSPFEIDANETKELNLRISIPSDAREDDYYLTLLFSSQPNAGQISTGSRQAGTIGANLLITISKEGKPLKKAEISEFRLFRSLFSVFSFQFLDSFDQPQYLIRLKNSGKTFWKPFGQVKVTGTLNQKWANDLQSENILANSIRGISLATPSAQPNFFLGAYKATLEFQTDEEEEKYLRTVAFISLPFKLILALLLAFILLKTIRFYTQRRT